MLWGLNRAGVGQNDCRRSLGLGAPGGAPMGFAGCGSGPRHMERMGSCPPLAARLGMTKLKAISFSVKEISTLWGAGGG